MHYGRLGIPIIAFVAVLLFEANAQALKNRTVAIIHNQQERLMVRLKAELTSHGFQPISIPAQSSADTEELRKLSEEHHAVAVIQIASSGDRVNVWIGGKQDAPMEVQQEIFVPKTTPDAHTLIVYKTVELLRASLLHLPPASPPDKPGSPPTQNQVHAVEQAKDAEAKRLAFRVQPALTYGFDVLPPAFQISAGLYVRLWKRLGLALFTLAPTHTMKHDETEGRAKLRATLLAIGLEASLLPLDRRIQANLGAGIGPLFVKMEGEPNAQYKGETDFVVSATPHIILGLAAMLSTVVALRFDVYAGWGANRVVVKMAGREVIEWARPLLSAMVGVELWVF